VWDPTHVHLRTGTLRDEARRLSVIIKSSSLMEEVVRSIQRIEASIVFSHESDIPFTHFCEFIACSSGYTDCRQQYLSSVENMREIVYEYMHIHMYV